MQAVLMTTRRSDRESFEEWALTADVEDAIAAEEDPEGYRRWLEQREDEEAET